MKRDSSRRSASCKTSAELKRELERIRREETTLAKRRQALDDALAKAAEHADEAPKGKTKKARAKPKKRKWKAGRPPLPYPDFPLTPHALGYWQKKIRGKIHYFGRWGRIVNGKMERVPGDGWKEALEKYKALADDLHAGRTPRETAPDGLTVGDLCNRFFTAKTRQLQAGEISPRTLTEYTNTTDRLVSLFGRNRPVADLASDDFERLRAELAKQYGPVRLGNEVQRVRTVFKYGYEAGLTDKPVRFGPQFVKPSKAVMRKHKAKSGSRMFDAEEVRSMLDTVPLQLRAMVLLGINCGFGNSDCASLPLASVDLDAGWIRFPRPKTGVERRCPLWPETVEALRAAIDARPEPKDEADADLLFITKYGKRWVRTRETVDKDGNAKHTPIDSVGLEFGKVTRSLGLNGRRGFYALRHTFRTIADATRDFPAVRLIMGHADGSIDDVYREHIDDARLREVVEFVRTWLLSDSEGGAK